MKLRTALDHAHNHLGAIHCKDPSLTQQQFKDESDPVFIAERFKLTGTIPQVLDLPTYGDFTGIFDYQTAMNAVRRGHEQFMTLPAKIRARFDNEPQKLMEFLSDKENRPEAEKLGLINKKEQKQEPAPAPAPAPAPTPKPAPAPAPAPTPNP